MTRSAASGLGKSAERLLERLAAAMRKGGEGRAFEPVTKVDARSAAELLAADLAMRRPDGGLDITPAGGAFMRRREIARGGKDVDPYLGQHLALARRDIAGPDGRLAVTIDEAESPLAWLARRKGRDGRPLIEPEQLAAGERLRSEFTRAQLMPRVTSNWQAAVAHGARSAEGARSANLTDVIVAARQRIHRALDAVGPEFAGLLVDVCCFLKGLEDIERERLWPSRSAKVVLQLGLDRLARHYGFSAPARGKARVPIRTWLATDASFVVDGE